MFKPTGTTVQVSKHGGVVTHVHRVMEDGSNTYLTNIDTRLNKN